MTDNASQERLSKALRWAGRILASIAAGVWLFVMIMQVVVGLQKGQDVLTTEGALLASLVLFNLSGTVLSWRRNAAGSKILLAGGFALSLFTILAAGRNRSFAVAISGLPFFISGILLWLSTRSNAEKGLPG